MSIYTQEETDKIIRGEFDNKGKSNAKEIQEIIFKVFGDNCTIIKNSFSAYDNNDNCCSSSMGDIKIKLNDDFPENINLNHILMYTPRFTIDYDDSTNTLILKI